MPILRIIYCYTSSLEVAAYELCLIIDSLWDACKKSQPLFNTVGKWKVNGQRKWDNDVMYQNISSHPAGKSTLVVDIMHKSMCGYN